MISSQETDLILDLLKKEVVPAIGCTEPIAVAYTVARATELLGGEPHKTDVKLSANVLKNAMGVGIPSTGMTGLPIAIALGATVGRSDYGLEVLRDVTPEAVSYAKGIIADGGIAISLTEESDEKLYIDIVVTREGHTARVIVAIGHTNIVFESKNAEILLDRRSDAVSNEEGESLTLSMRKVYEFATETALDKLLFILESKELNMRAAEAALKGSYGHNIGRLMNGTIFGDNTFTKILSYTSAACDARMAGAMIPVMSNSGSGNQGIAATLPVVVYAQQQEASQEQLVRALVLSHLTVIHMKEELGRLSAMCGCVVAATGSSCGITYLMGGDYLQVTYAVKNMVANLTGIICDGAKPSCALKISSGVSTAVISAAMATNSNCVESVEGIIDDDVEKCIENLTRIGAGAMSITDDCILEIMTSKGC